jgi:hypothetical protein
MSIRIGMKGYKDLAIWQPILFRKIPYHCYRCNGKGHLARDYQEFGAQNGHRPQEEDGVNSAALNAVESPDLQLDGTGGKPAEANKTTYTINIRIPHKEMVHANSDSTKEQRRCHRISNTPNTTTNTKPQKSP